MHYCTQSAWSIALDLNVASSVFRSLIWFIEYPWYCLVCDVQEVITTTRDLLKWSSLSVKWFTRDCYVLRFYSQYCYSKLSKWFSFILSQDTHEEVHLLIFLLTYNNIIILIMFYIKLSQNFALLTNIEYFYIVVYLNTQFL